MKKLFVFLTVAGLVMAGSGTTLVLAQTTYDLYATTKGEYQSYTSNFALRYIDLDGDQKFSMDEELISFSGVTFQSVTYTEILGVPNNNLSSPYTDGPNSMFFDWYFNKPSNVLTTAYIAPNVWTYSQVPVSRGVSVSIPGFTVVQDQEGDLLLRNCDDSRPGIPCSLYDTTPSYLVLPGYFDIKNAKIMQHGPKYVDLFIALYEPLPQPPEYPQYPFGFVNYFWQFEGGCVAPPDKLKKAGVSFTWNVNVGAWKANWYVIDKCIPRVAVQGDEITSFEFTADGVKVRVSLDDIKEALDEDGKLTWHAGVRWVPFIYPNGCEPPGCWNSVAVDYVPDVLELLPCVPSPAPCSWKPELAATWEPR